MILLVVVVAVVVLALAAPIGIMELHARRRSPVIDDARWSEFERQFWLYVRQQQGVSGRRKGTNGG